MTTRLFSPAPPALLKHNNSDNINMRLLRNLMTS